MHIFFTNVSNGHLNFSVVHRLPVPTQLTFFNWKPTGLTLMDFQLIFAGLRSNLTGNLATFDDNSARNKWKPRWFSLDLWLKKNQRNEREKRMRMNLGMKSSFLFYFQFLPLILSHSFHNLCPNTFQFLLLYTLNSIPT